VNISKLQPGPIRHPQLTDEQLARIRKIHEAFLEVNDIPFEKTVENFQRDVDPEEEIVIWETIAKAYIEYTSKHKLTLEKKKSVYAALILRSMAPEEYVLEQLKSNPLSANILSDEEVKEVLKHYQAAEVPLSIILKEDDTFSLN
jgi:hypothetical protein